MDSETSEIQRLVASERFEALLSGRDCLISSQEFMALRRLGLEPVTQGSQCRLTALPTLLDLEWIKERLGQVAAVYYDLTVDSTNRLALSNRDEGGAVYLTEFQAQGRGRSGRQWLSPFAANLTLSFVRTLNQSVSALSGLSLAVGSCLVRCLRSKGLDDLMLKWPNDLLISGQKTAGILIEIDPLSLSKVRVIIGIGVNVEACPGSEEIGQVATKLRVATELSRSELAVIIVKALDQALTEFEDHGLDPVVEQWAGVDAYIGQSVVILQNGESIVGENRGIDDRGNLLLRTSEGLRAFSVGDVSLRQNSGVMD